MGDEDFDALGRAFVGAHPSRHPSIRWFGAELAEFMRSHEALVPHPAMSDLARMDWALRNAFDAADAEPVARERLAALAPAEWPMACFAWHPSVDVLALDWRVEPAWRALRQSLDAGAAEAELPPPEAGAHALLVWRFALQPQWRSLEEGEAALLRHARAGEPFAALCEAAAHIHGEEAAAAQVAGALQQWIAEGLIVGVGQAGVAPDFAAS